MLRRVEGICVGRGKKMQVTITDDGTPFYSTRVVMSPPGLALLGHCALTGDGPNAIPKPHLLCQLAHVAMREYPLHGRLHAADFGCIHIASVRVFPLEVRDVLRSRSHRP